MGLAIDTIVGVASNPSTTFTAVTMATGDSATVRSFDTASYARLERIIRAGAATGGVRVRSPLMHDGVQGIKFTTAESPAVLLFPQEHGEPLNSSDNLTIELTGGTSESDLAALVLFYANLRGAAARLASWGDIAGVLKHIKTVEVDVTSSATAGLWVDTVMTTTEDLLHANSDYAVLGYVTDVAVDIAGIKGPDTGNLRICGPGTTATDDTSDYFVKYSDRENGPRIPIISANNRYSTYVSVNHRSSVTPKIQLVLGELTQNFAS